MGLDERSDEERSENPGLTRRRFLDRSAKGLAVAGLAPLWLDAAVARSLGLGERPPFLAVIFLRGAADGLMTVSDVPDQG